MRTAADIVGYVNLALFALLAIVAVVQWRRNRGAPAIWAALTFVVIAVVVDAGPLLPDPEDGSFALWLQKLLIVLLLLFPYFLYRFAGAFDPARRLADRAALALTLGVMAWTVALPDLPSEGEERPGWFVAYIVALVVQWVSLSLVVVVRLWRAGRSQPSVARRRMRLLALAAGGLALALVVAAFAEDAGPGVDLTSAFLVSASAVSFLFGLAPPEFVRVLWRRPEQDRLRTGLGEVVAASSGPREVAERVLPHMADIVAARGVALFDEKGEVLAARGIEPDEALRALATGSSEAGFLKLPFVGGTLLLWTSPYAPFFGQEEVALLASFGNLTGLALDRSRLFADEREARLALERADELKSNFIALAAHELRTPVGVILGVTQTLDVRREALAPEQEQELRALLSGQVVRLAALVEQLLDLSRLEAEAVELAPIPFEVRERVEEIVQASAGEHADEIGIEVAAGLEATADPNAFDRILSNLVTNALRYGAAPVKVSAEQRDRHFRVAVEDRGPGVPREFVPELFERFSRARSSESGTGLGLAIARSYAQAHGGDLLYTPISPHGSRFELVLPRAGNGF